MIDKESDVRMIGYGSMLIEGLVGVVALIAAASLPVDLYYDINVDLDKAPQFQKKLDELYTDLKIDRNAARAQIGVHGHRPSASAGREPGGRWSSSSAANRCAAAPAGRSRWPSACRAS